MARKGSTRRRMLATGAVTLGAAALGGVGGAWLQRLSDAASLPPPLPSRTLLDDASGLNPTPVRGVAFTEADPDAAAARLAPLLRRIAAGEEPALAVSGARHSMGGQSLLRDGWALDALPLNGLAIDAGGRVMRVGGGALWRDVVPALNAAGFSPAVMQSNNDFSIGGTLSVNAHGWHANSPPAASTVRRLRLLTADGAVIDCGPGDELFGLALGGYGLFGVILEAEIAILPNAMYVPDFATMPTRDYAAAFAERVVASVEMAYGRLSVDPGSLFEEAVLGWYVPVPETRGTVLPLPALDTGGMQRLVFRNAAGSDTGKAVRWWLEREAGPWLAERTSRNSLLNEPASVFANREAGSTDILHEYFVPRARLWDFAQAARTVIRRDDGNLLNVTVRDVRRDERSALAYAREDVFGLVMLFVQEKSAAGEERMQRMTRGLIDAALDVGGTHYLPYRLHATPEQLRRAYPTWDEVVAAQRRHDPNGVFRNGLFRRYAER
ncbi:FAD-binding oxidoreductase [Inquilinus sp.]|uniref:FAD-binding oxidoreductase n=1 Tax=Inquilinus sp. TaxID=1932117 RepID=UPI0031DF3274